MRYFCLSLLLILLPAHGQAWLTAPSSDAEIKLLDAAWVKCQEINFAIQPQCQKIFEAERARGEVRDAERKRRERSESDQTKDFLDAAIKANGL
jgi:hypothetical protein